MKRIYLYGPPASGKTTLGKALAGSLGARFVDLDAEIERRLGYSITECFAAEGESGFRSLESSVLREIVATDAEIVSLGGGTLLDPMNRGLCERDGAVFCIDPPSAAVLAERIAAAPGSRPLGDMSVARKLHYAQFRNRLSAWFDLGDSLVLVGAAIAEPFLGSGRNVVDENVHRLYPQIDALHVIPSGEAHKTPETLMKIWSAFARAGIGRQDRVTAIGGGVTGDMTGFAAATWMRGIDWINIPTTLLSMVDASTGGKTGCDLAEGKNLAGAFHLPRLVVIDTEFLKSLSAETLADGRAEMIKHEVIGGLKTHQSDDASCLKAPTAAEIAANLAVKVGIVREDPLERKGKRMLLNCGHTIGHAVEKTCGYRLSHGRSVAIGCVEEARLAVRLGLAPDSWPEKLAERFVAAGLPVAYPEGMDFESLKEVMLRDKKKTSNDSVVFALPCGWGDVRLKEVKLA